MDNINEIQTDMKQHLVDTYKQVELTQSQIDMLYFNLVHYVKTLADVDRLHDLNITQQQMFKTELELIKKFSKL
jgi:hypothetical protein